MRAAVAFIACFFVVLSVAATAVAEEVPKPKGECGGSYFQQYLKEPGRKAFAYAEDSSGLRTCGYSYRAGTLDQAKTAALRQCRDGTAEFDVDAECQIVATDDKALWDERQTTITTQSRGTERYTNADYLAAAVAWASIMNSTQAVEIRRFLTTHSDTEFAPLARARLRDIRAAKPEERTTQSRSTEPYTNADYLAAAVAWASIMNSTQAVEIRRFLTTHSDTEFAPLARSRLESLERELAASRAADTAAPVIDMPTQVDTDQAVIDIVGHVADESAVVEVTLNDRAITLGSGNRFRVQRAVPIGTSEVRIAALDEWGNRAEKRVVINRTAVERQAREVARVPSVARENKLAIAVIIGNKNYVGPVPVVEFAHNDADAIRRFVVEVLGYRDGNIIDLRDATRAQIDAVFGTEKTHEGKLYNWVRQGKSDVLVYYSGHGVPGLQDRRGYLLGVDGDPNLAEITGYPVEVLYDNLAKIEARSITVFLDACFSGESQKGMLVRATSGISVNPKLPPQNPALTVLTAAQGN